MALRPGICGIVWRPGHSVRSVAARPVRWLVLGACVSTGRAFSARAAGRHGSVEHVFVRCRTSGSMIISLYNVLEHPPTTPLLLYLPPSPQPHIKATEDFEDHADARPTEYTDDLARPPDYLLRMNIPIVAIRYRWEAAKMAEADRATATIDARTKAQPLAHLWPTPLHDIMFAYDWIQKHLAPLPDSRPRRRRIYVYGSYLGASLATSLALTEAHEDRPMAISGVAAYNGIYNWTAFVNMEGEAGDGIPVTDNATTTQRVAPGTPPLPSLFATPADLFDSFLSPCLFFRTPGHVFPPLDFDREVSRTRFEETERELEKIEELSKMGSDRKTILYLLGMLPKAYLAHPPADSTLSIPPALLMHTGVSVEADTAADHGSNSSNSSTSSHDTDRRKQRNIFEAVHGNNSYATQANEMAGLMRRGIDKYEPKGKRCIRTEEQLSWIESAAYQNYPLKVQMAVLAREASLVSEETESKSKVSERRVRQVSVGASPRHGSLELGEKGQEILVGWLCNHLKIAGGDGPKL